jgi:hypothetical protein
VPRALSAVGTNLYGRILRITDASSTTSGFTVVGDPDFSNQLSLLRGAPPLGLPYTLTRGDPGPAPFACLAR